MNLADLWTGDLSLRRLRALLTRLPHTSRLTVAIHGPTHEGWDLHAYLLAALVDAVNANTHATVQIQSRHRIRRPAPVPRPGSAATRRRVVRVAQLPGARPTTT